MMSSGLRAAATYSSFDALATAAFLWLLCVEMKTSIHALFETAKRNGQRRAWSFGDRTWTWGEAAGDVRKAARAFLALGVKPGGAVSVVGTNRPEWVIADLGAIAAGGVPAPIYPTLTAEQAGYIANHSEATVAVVLDKAQLDKLRLVRPPNLRWFVLMTGEPDAKDVLSWEQFMARAEETPDAEIDKRLDGIDPTGIATLIYTSGTTGPPKAAMLTHKNLEFAARIAQQVADVRADDVMVSYLPLSHIAEQMLSIHGPIVSGGQIAFCDDFEKLVPTLQKVEPTIFFGVPRVWEKVQAGLEAKFAEAPEGKRKLLAWARGPHLLLGGLADKLVLAKIRKAMGFGRVRFCVTAAAKISDGTLRFFDSLGMPIYDVWGMTESAGMGTANMPGARKVGTVGRPEDGVEIRIASDGEILTRGAHVFKGYFKDEAGTRETLDSEGFLHTGDVGEIDGDGFMRITDRKKDLLITSGGKNVSPQNIEAQLAQITGVAQAVVVGDARKYLAALIVPDAVAKASEPEFVAHVGREIEKVNARLAQYETIKRFKVLSAQFSIASGELTPTLKLKRKVVSQKYAADIEALFSESRPG
jgi:long-subunit acyl-CoA synthetase (AMP-forming)